MWLTGECSTIIQKHVRNSVSIRTEKCIDRAMSGNLQNAFQKNVTANDDLNSWYQPVKLFITSVDPPKQKPGECARLPIGDPRLGSLSFSPPSQIRDSCEGDDFKCPGAQKCCSSLLLGLSHYQCVNIPSAIE